VYESIIEKTSPSAPYKVGEIISFGFCDWKVLEIYQNRTLIISNDVIEKCAYHVGRQDVTWQTCSLRKYLNGEFYNRFSNADKMRILETKVINDKNPWFGTDGGKNTDDNIFLLSIEEVVKFFGDSGQLRGKNPNSKLFINDQYKAKRIAKFAGMGSWWWLRSPGLRSRIAANIFAGGAVHVSGHYVDNGFGGIRPVLYLRNP